jgi:hypothetical protein
MNCLGSLTWYVIANCGHAYQIIEFYMNLLLNIGPVSQASLTLTFGHGNGEKILLSSPYHERTSCQTCVFFANQSVGKHRKP